MRKLSVLFMQSQSYFGADSLIHATIMRYLDRSRVEVHVACNPGTAEEKSPALQALETIPDLHVRPTNFGPSLKERTVKQVAVDVARGVPSLASLGGLVRYVRQHRIDVIHGTEKPRDAFYGLLIARMSGAKAITHLHVKVENWISPLVRWAMKHDDGLVAISDFVAGSTIQMGFDPRRIHTVLNCLDAGRWDYTVDGSAVRREFGLAPNVPTLAVISRLFPWKGHTELFHALAKVKLSMPGFKLLVVGEDDPRATPGGGSYLSQLKTLSVELGLTEHVIFTGFRRDIAQILAACDIFSMPSFEEPFGLVFLEAMAMKKPVIALESGGVPELVDHGGSGLLSKSKDTDALAANIVTLLRDPELRARMGAHGRERTEQVFTPTRMATEMERVYRRVLGLAD